MTVNQKGHVHTFISNLTWYEITICILAIIGCVWLICYLNRKGDHEIRKSVVEGQPNSGKARGSFSRPEAKTAWCINGHRMMWSNIIPGKQDKELKCEICNKNITLKHWFNYCSVCSNGIC